MCSIHQWVQNPVFAAAGKAACDVLTKNYVIRSYPRGEILITEGEVADHVYVLFRGVFRLFHRTNDGRAALVRLVQAPAMYGIDELYHSNHFMRSVAVVEEADVGLIPFEEYTAFLQKYPAAMMVQIQQLAISLCLSSRYEYNVFASAEEKVANVLLSYADLYGRRVESDLIVDYPLTQQDLALSIGAVQRSVANVIAKWRDEKVVTKRNGRFVIHKAHTLENLATLMRNSLGQCQGTSLSPSNQVIAPFKETPVSIIEKITDQHQSTPC